MNIEDKRDCIVKVFARYLYGHIIPSTFNTSNGGWCDWANLVRRFADFLEHPKNIKYYDMPNEIERLQEELVDFSKNTHKSRYFPVVPCLKEKLYYRIKELFEELNWTISSKFLHFLLEDNVEEISRRASIARINSDTSDNIELVNSETEFLFKTYEILQGMLLRYRNKISTNNTNVKTDTVKYCHIILFQDTLLLLLRKIGTHLVTIQLAWFLGKVPLL